MKNKLKHKIRVTIGILLLIISIVSVLYFNCWCTFISPAINICRALNTHTITAQMIGTTLVKSFFSYLIGSVIGVLGYYFGMFLVFNESKLD